MSTSLHRFFVHTDGHDEPRQVLTPLLLELGLRIVDEPEPDLITRVVRVWRSGDWIVIDDEGGELGEDARDSRRWRTRSLAVQVLHSDVAVVERYDSTGRIGSVSIRPRGGVPRKAASVFSALVADESVDALEAALGADVDGVESKLERVFEALGLPSAIEVPSQTEVLVLTDGRTRPVVQPSSPPYLWTPGLFGDVTLNGIEGQRLSTGMQYLSIANVGGYASSLVVEFSGSALEGDLLAIERVLLTPQPGGGWIGAEAQPVVVASCEGEPVRFDVGAVSNVSGAQRLDNTLPQFTAREGWWIAIEGTRRERGAGELIVTVTADESTVTARADVFVVGSDQVPRRATLPESPGTGGSTWDGLKALIGDRCLAATMELSPAADVGDARSIVLERWAETVFRSRRIERLPIKSDIKGVRNLTLADLGRGKRWSKLEDQLGEAVFCLVGPDLSTRPIRTVYKCGIDEPRVVHATFDLDTVDEEDARTALTSIVDRLVSTGSIEQATITPCDHGTGYGSRYEWAVMADRQRSGGEYLSEPGRAMYLAPSLVDRLDRAELDRFFDVQPVGDRLRLVARPATSFLDIEQVVTPILRPVSSPTAD